MTNNKYCRILSCDGGGIRGLISAAMLERLEQKLKQHEPSKRLIDYFDIIAGTSTGSLIACGLAKGLNAREIKSLYIRRGIEIFPPFSEVAYNILLRIRIGFSQPIYDGKGLERVLKQELEEALFRDLAKPTIVTSYDTYNRQAVMFKNTKPAHENIPVWEVCRSSAAAPVAFPGHKMTNQDFLQDWKEKGFKIPQEGGIPLIDGGVVANDPALCAIAERLRWNEKLPSNPKWSNAIGQQKVGIEKIVVASFGTGQNLNRIGNTEAREWGLLEWASPRRGIPLLDVLFDGSSDAVSYVAEEILNSKHFRFQPHLNQDLPAFSANSGNIEAMQQVTETFLSQPGIDDKLNRLVNMLTEEQS